MSAACYHGNQVVYITKVVHISLSPTKIMRPRRAGPVAQMKKPTSRFPLREGVAAEEPVIERVLRSDGRLSVFSVGRWLCGAFSVWSQVFVVSSASRGSRHILCLAFTMGELGRALCVGNFRGVLCFTFCYNEVNANCCVCVCLKLFCLVSEG